MLELIQQFFLSLYFIHGIEHLKMFFSKEITTARIHGTNEYESI